MNSINLTRIDDGEAVSEYYKQLRTNIYFCGQDKQCIAFTSSFPNEGIKCTPCQGQIKKKGFVLSSQ